MSMSRSVQFKWARLAHMLAAERRETQENQVLSCLYHPFSGDFRGHEAVPSRPSPAPPGELRQLAESKMLELKTAGSSF